MKRDKLYKVTKGNLFALGDQIQTTGLSVSGTPTFADYGYDKAPNIPKIDLSNYYKPKNSFFSNQTAQQGLGVAANMADQIPTGDKRGLYDTLDPLYHLAGGKESAVGNGLSDVGVGLFKTGAQSGNGWLMLAGAGAKVLGGAYNTLFGTKWNNDLIEDIEKRTNAMRGVGNMFGKANDSNTFFDVASNIALQRAFKNKDVGSTGWLRSNDSVDNKANNLRSGQSSAAAYQLHAMSNAARQIDKEKDDLILYDTPTYTSFAEGGLLTGLNNNNNMGAIEYGLASDYLTYKKKQADNKNTMTNMFAGMPGVMLADGGYMNPNMGDTDMDNIFKKGGKIHIKKSHQGRLTELKKRTGKTEAELWAEGKPEVRKMITFARNARRWKKAYGGFLDAADNLFAIGGDMQTNGSDFTNGAIHVDEGGTHEENPNQGVQMGVDNEGTPNLVEEGEVIFNDYVYSNRIELDSEAKEKMHFPKKRDITYADAAKSLEKESKERPNDPISKAALKVQMEDLANEQERQKQEMEAERAREAFEALSPEEQVAVMQQASEQEQMAQEQAMQEQAMAEQAAAQQQAMGQPSPEEMAMMQQQQMMAQPQAVQPEMMEGQPMMAYGGNLYAWGGDKMNQALRFLKEKGITGNTAKDIATAMSRMPYANNPNTSINYLYGKLLKGFNASEKGYEENYRQMRELGMSHNSAMAVLKQQRPTKWNSSRDASMRQWDKLGNTWQQSYNHTVTQPKRKGTVYTDVTGRVYNTRAEAVAANTEIQKRRRVSNVSNNPQTPVAQAVSQNGASATTSQAARATRRAVAPVVNQRAAVSPVASVPQGNDSGFLAPAAYMNNATWNLGNYDWLTNPEYQDSLTEGHIPFSRSASPEDIARAENSNTFRNWTDYVLKNWENPDVQGYLKELDRVAGGNHLFNPDGTPVSVEDAQAYFQRARGMGDNADHAWGYYHLTPSQIANNPAAATPAASQSKVYHLMEGDDGDYISEGDATKYPETRRVTDDQGNVHVYHKAPQNAVLTEEQLEKAVPGSTVQNKSEEEYDVVPVHKDVWPRYAGLLGPAVGLGMMAAGIGRPDNKRWSNIVEAAQGPASLADYQVIGNYLRYKPLDIWAEQNRLNANTRATDRALTNNSSPIGTRMAGLLANEYANQLGSANLFRQAQEYNDNLRRVVGEYNKDTDKFNAEAYNRAALTNAEIRNRQKQFAANIALQAEHAKANADADWYNGIYGNISGLFKGIGDIGRENAQHNMIADMAATGIFGTIKNQPIANGFIKVVPKKNTTAKGGKISKKKGKRGLTF